MALAFVREYRNFERLRQEHGLAADYNDVVADFGKVVERDSWAFIVRSERSLPHPKALVRSALYAAFAEADGHDRDVVEAGIWILTQYAPEAEIASEPETLAVWKRLYDLMARVGRGEISAELALEETGRIVVAAGPLGAPRRLHRVHRRSRAACWLDLLEHFPEVWPESSRAGVHLEWIYEHAGDVLETAKEAMAQLQKGSSQSADERTRAVAYFDTLYKELGDLLNEATGYKPPKEEEARHDSYVSVVGWAGRNLREYVEARLSGDSDAAAKSGRQFTETMDLLEQWDSTYHQARELSARSSPTGVTPAVPAAPPPKASSRRWVVAAIAAASLAAAYFGVNAIRAQADLAPSPDGSCAESHPIKGNLASSGEKIYHLPGGQFYRVTNAERCFGSEAEATTAGFRASSR